MVIDWDGAGELTRADRIGNSGRDDELFDGSGGGGGSSVGGGGGGGGGGEGGGPKSFIN